ncbi:hypothetical protein BJF85_12870 [Saccharomonospora sp. CUA-673]|uniref:type II secretion system F family protein n=1 Tax=Saccharomonospora sp. CUA-673 TaxID=1904969 RepID=UPI000964617E|nr:type II secretion system F family protein [Saccharomonospora sp. CUA-673]OLT48402.1 hypothetical protein BJF85_12870 [Saccharomonospora sp. CUA-673]
MVTSWTSSVACCGIALMLWPGPQARIRLATLGGPGVVERIRGWRTRLGRRRVRALALGAVMLGVTPWTGAGPATAAVLVGAAIAVHVRTRRRSSRDVRAMARTAQTLRAMAGDLRAGAHPAHAAETAAQDADPDVAAVLAATAATARLGGEPELVRSRAPDVATDAAVGTAAGAVGRTTSDSSASHSVPDRETVSAAALRRLAAAWSLARRHGLPLADVVDAVQRDVESRARLAAQLDARMAGPRASALMLAALPVLGVLLGEGMGAAPLTVLSTTAAGQVLFVVGAGLLLAGVGWTAAITGRVTPR